jgi:hypothetical protein
VDNPEPGVDVAQKAEEKRGRREVSGAGSMVEPVSHRSNLDAGKSTSGIMGECEGPRGSPQGKPERRLPGKAAINERKLKSRKDPMELYYTLVLCSLLVCRA